MTYKRPPHPSKLKGMREVTQYWRHCLTLLEKQTDDKAIAGYIVGVISNEREEEWYSGPNVHPAFALIFELAASLEIPQGKAEWRMASWDCIRVLVGVLESRYLDSEK